MISSDFAFYSDILSMAIYGYTQSLPRHLFSHLILPEYPCSLECDSHSRFCYAEWTTDLTVSDDGRLFTWVRESSGNPLSHLGVPEYPCCPGVTFIADFVMLIGLMISNYQVANRYIFPYTYLRMTNVQESGFWLPKFWPWITSFYWDKRI